MVVFPNCKINIGLNITGKRPDGFHNLQTVFYPLAIKDALEIIEENDSQQAVKFTFSGLIIEGKESENICIKAYRLLKQDFPGIPSIKIHLHKAIPMGAGLGGGSADGAFTLQLINNKFSLGLSQNNLLSYALQLGSDCPFFILNEPCFATGRGEQLQPISLDLSSYKFAVINPGIYINTGEAFSEMEKHFKNPAFEEFIKKPVEDWKNLVSNDFEASAFKHHPEIGEAKEQLYAAGAIYASMSGSGSTVYGIFKKEQQPVFNLPAHYFFCWA